MFRNLIPRVEARNICFDFGQCTDESHADKKASATDARIHSASLAVGAPDVRNPSHAHSISVVGQASLAAVTSSASDAAIRRRRAASARPPVRIHSSASTVLKPPRYVSCPMAPS